MLAYQALASSLPPFFKASHGQTKDALAFQDRTSPDSHLKH